MLEAKIAVLSTKIASARIIDETKIDISSVQMLNKVTIRNKINNATMQYIIVSEPEADLKLGKISIQTPIAKGLMGKKLGDIVEIQVPSGKMQFEIIDIAI